MATIQYEFLPLELTQESLEFRNIRVLRFRFFVFKVSRGSGKFRYAGTTGLLKYILLKCIYLLPV